MRNNPNASLLSCNTKNENVQSSNGFWSKRYSEVGYNQLQKFWSELSPQSQKELLQTDKQAVLEQARKNMYCSRCNGLLLEGFTQIVISGKNLQHQNKVHDPSDHPWGGLTPTNDGALTLLDCFLDTKSLKGIQNVFNSAWKRENERESLYPHACGRSGKLWTSQGITSYGRGHVRRERCSLHTARLSCDTLVDFWLTLGEEMRQSLFTMKEEDFIERLMHRFDAKKFCKECRRNVIREFKELKELKRIRREPQCTSWFCGADTDIFQYEVSNDTIRADWHQLLTDSDGTYHHLEWAVGSSKGTSDILEFENVGMKGSVQVSGLDLGGLNACYITLHAWRQDGMCSEFSVKAHALEGRQCVHCRLEIGDGYVKVSCGESIRRFFEHAEEVEEEEDDDSADKEGNHMDGEGSRPQKHAKSPELAREFLLEAATVLFKEQVEKTFREETARQNAHSILVCLTLKLLEERIHIACKDLVTLEKQMKLLEEEENGKREEEERKERKKTKEKEKKLRRKERLRGKDKDKKCYESNHTPINPDSLEEANNNDRDSVSESDDTPGVHDELSPNNYPASAFSKNGFNGTDGDLDDAEEGNGFLYISHCLRDSHQNSSVTRFTRANMNAQGNFGRRGKVLNYSNNTNGRRFDRNSLSNSNTSTMSREVGRCKIDVNSEVDVTSSSYNRLNDSNTASSSHPSAESSSISDSNETTKQTEGRASSVRVQKGLSEARDIQKEKTKNTTQSSSFSLQKVGSHFTWNCPSNKPAQKSEETNIASCVQLPNPNTSFLSFQNPMALSTAPQNGLITYPNPNHYLPASPSDGVSPYFTSPNQIPVYQQAPNSNCDQSNAIGLRNPWGESRTEKETPIGSVPKEEKKKLNKTGHGNTGFSLFQFGGSVPTYRSNLQSSNECKSCYISCCHVEVEGGNTCSKEETSVGEYNLFAKSNGIHFSIF